MQISPDIFISYSSNDERIARFIQAHLSREGMQAFLAATSLLPGQCWSSETLAALKNSPWMLFLASRSACESAWVQQELGAAVAAGKTIVPVVWDMSPLDLPGWVRHYQVLDLKHASLDEIGKQMTGIAHRIKSSKVQALLIAGLIIAALCVFGSK